MILDQHGEDPEDEAGCARFDQIQERIAELADGEEAWPDAVKAIAGRLSPSTVTATCNPTRPDPPGGQGGGAENRQGEARQGWQRHKRSRQSVRPVRRADRRLDHAPDGGAASQAGRQSEGGTRRHRSRAAARLPLQDEPDVMRQGQRLGRVSQAQRRLD